MSASRHDIRDDHGRSTTVASTGCVVTPERTADRYPDQAGMINKAGFFRQDITEGRRGTPVTLVLTIVNASRNRDGDKCPA